MGGRVSVVGNYQSLQSFSPKRNISRADLGLRPDDFVVAYIGGFTRVRLILPLIEATEYTQDVTVLLAGDGPQRVAVESKLPDHPGVRYLGQVPQDHVPDYTNLADVIYYGINASDGNAAYSCPNTLFNALTAGKPLLTTNVGEIAHIVREEQCGVVVEQATPSLLAQAIVQLRDSAIYQSLAVNARRAAETKYNWAVAQAVLLDLYRQLITDVSVLSS
jgi:glycosyltransferase involved in cell wall biosynthesis